LIDELKEAGWPSLVDVGREIHSLAEKKGLISRREHPRRIRFEIPMVDPLVRLVRTGGPAREEVGGIVEAVRSYHADAATLARFSVKEHVSLLDISRVQRLAWIVAAYVSTELQRHVEDAELFFNSVTPVFRDEALDELLGVPLEREESVKEFKELFGWPARGAGKGTQSGFFDIQYRPMIRATDDPSKPLPAGSDEWSVPFYVLAGSELVRAALLLTQKRPFDDSRREILGSEIALEIQALGQTAKAGVKLPAADDRLEIDLVAVVDDALLVLECKASLLPCSPFELRRSYDHCARAAGQLSRLLETLSSEDGRRSVCKQIGVKPDAVKRILTGIVIDNGLFAGLRVGGHPVLSHRHFMTFLRGKPMTILGEDVPLRAEGRVTRADLERFLGGDTYGRFFRAMVPVRKELRLGRSQLLRETYALAGELLAAEFGVKWDPPRDVPEP